MPSDTVDSLSILGLQGMISMTRRNVRIDIFATVLLLFVVNSLSAAPTRYDYVGPNFTNFQVSADYSGALYDASMRLSGYVVLSTPLLPDTDYLRYQLEILDFSFSDGLQTLNFHNASMNNEDSDLRFTTDVTGIPRLWNASFAANKRSGELYFPARLQTIAVYYEGVGFPPFNFFDALESATTYDAIDPNCSANFCASYSSGYRTIDIFDPDPILGVWSLHPVPLPTTAWFFASSLIGMGLFRRRYK